jgi:hypothetical protein
MQKKVTITLDVDFELLRKQKAILLDCKEDIPDVEALEAIEGVIMLINGIQDDAVGTGQVYAEDVYDKPVEKTEDAYEEYCNDLYSPPASWERVFDQFVYLTNNHRIGESITEEELQAKFYLGSIGTLLRKLDPIRFQVGFNEWNP